jgi:hypothetical protein
MVEGETRSVGGDDCGVGRSADESGRVLDGLNIGNRRSRTIFSGHENGSFGLDLEGLMADSQTAFTSRKRILTDVSGRKIGWNTLRVGLSRRQSRQGVIQIRPGTPDNFNK